MDVSFENRANYTYSLLVSYGICEIVSPGERGETNRKQYTHRTKWTHWNSHFVVTIFPSLIVVIRCSGASSQAILLQTPINIHIGWMEQRKNLLIFSVCNVVRGKLFNFISIHPNERWCRTWWICTVQHIGETKNKCRFCNFFNGRCDWMREWHSKISSIHTHSPLLLSPIRYN